MKECNKAGYTANTSCGRVGRGGNACFHTFQLNHYRPTDGPTDKASYRVACPQLKMIERPLDIAGLKLQVGLLTLSIPLIND